jgi:hypothetical protein
MFGSLLDEMLGSGVKHVMQTVVHRATVPCSFCGTRTVFRCTACGNFVCNVHAFVNAPSWDKLTIICTSCASQFFPFVDATAAPPPPFHEQEWPYRQQPWDVLGVARDATEEEINNAFRERAKSAHPDIGGSHEEMSLLGEARMWMLEYLRRPK